MTFPTVTSYPVAGLPAEVYSVEYVVTEGDAYYTISMHGKNLLTADGDVATFLSFEHAAEALRGYVAWMQL